MKISVFVKSSGLLQSALYYVTIQFTVEENDLLASWYAVQVSMPIQDFLILETHIQLIFSQFSIILSVIFPDW